jgi:hypothetical protein
MMPVRLALVLGACFSKLTPAAPHQEERLWVAHITEGLLFVKHAGD